MTTLKVLISGRPICRGELLVSERVPFFFGKKRILPNVFENKKLGGGRNGFPFWGSPFFVWDVDGQSHWFLNFSVWSMVQKFCKWCVSDTQTGHTNSLGEWENLTMKHVRLDMVWLPQFAKCLIEKCQKISHQRPWFDLIFHHPRFPWNKGISLTKPPFGVRSCEVAIIWPDLMISFLLEESPRPSLKPSCLVINQNLEAILSNHWPWISFLVGEYHGENPPYIPYIHYYGSTLLDPYGCFQK